MKGLLACLYYFRPHSGTAAKRNTTLINSLSPYFDTVSVHTSAPQSEDNHIDVNQIKAWDYRSLLRKVTTSGHLSESRKSSLWMRFGIKLLNTFPINVLFGEGGGRYLWKNWRAGVTRIRKGEITHIYSSYRPFTDHIVAWLWKRQFPELVWIADFRDLVVEPIYQQQFFPGMHHFICRKLFARATVLTTVTEGFIPHLSKYNASVIPIVNGLPDDHTFPPIVANHRFEITYTGSMFKDERNPEPLFNALNHLIDQGLINPEKVVVRYAGKDGAIWRTLADRYALANLFIDEGMVSGTRAVEIQQSANILVLLTIADAQVQGVLTGKLVEYLATGRPTLCIVKNQHDALISQLFVRLNAGLCVSDHRDDLEDVKQFILEAYNHWTMSGTNRRTTHHQQLMAEFSATNSIKPLLQALAILHA